MRARDLMTAPVITVRSDSPVKDALKLLTANSFTALPVVNDNTLVGIVTEADLIHDRIPRDPRNRQGELDTSQHRSARMSVGSVMTSPAVTMGSGADLTDLCQALLDAHIRAMPIVDDGKVVGIVTRGDIVRVLARDDRVIAADIRHRLEIYGGLNRWTVDVEDGVVRIVDTFDNSTDRHVAALLAQAVPGVMDAQALSTTSAGNGRVRR
jgi:CBS domain-containing protein